jgi:hypothetical protein
MSIAKLIICEKAPRWAPALRALLSADTPLAEARSLTQCAEALAETPGSAVLVEITSGNLESAVSFVIDNSRRFSRACFLAALPVEMAGAEVLLREIGVAMVFASTLEAGGAAKLAMRHLAFHPPSEQALAEIMAAGTRAI